MTLTEYSKKHKVCRKTAWNHFQRGQIEGAYQLPSGKVVIPEETPKGVTVVFFEGTVEEARRRLGV